MSESASTAVHYLRAFGLSLRIVGELPPGAWEEQPLLEPAVELRRTTAEQIAESWSGRGTISWRGMIDKVPLVLEVGSTGDHRFVHGEAVYHLSADLCALQCAPGSEAGPLWWRVVLDTVLFTVALLRGYEALHAAAVATPTGAVAITSHTGGGKSTLLAELIRRELPLLADDIVVLERRAGTAPLAHPAPPLMTVPIGTLSAADKLGKTIAHVDDERWIALPVHPKPLPLAAIVQLDRYAGARCDLKPASQTFAPLLNSLQVYPRTSERERARFELASELSASVPMMTLTADTATSPETLADLLAAQEDLQIGRKPIPAPTKHVAF